MLETPIAQPAPAPSGKEKSPYQADRLRGVKEARTAIEVLKVKWPAIFNDPKTILITPESHMWTALPGKHFFGALNDLVGCGHMSGLFLRSIYPLALMKSDGRDPYQQCELSARERQRVVPGLR